MNEKELIQAWTSQEREYWRGDFEGFRRGLIVGLLLGLAGSLLILACSIGPIVEWVIG